MGQAQGDLRGVEVFQSRVGEGDSFVQKCRALLLALGQFFA